jgi:hypothetical protein
MIQVFKWGNFDTRFGDEEKLRSTPLPIHYEENSQYDSFWQFLVVNLAFSWAPFFA